MFFKDLKLRMCLKMHSKSFSKINYGWVDFLILNWGSKWGAISRRVDNHNFLPHFLNEVYFSHQNHDSGPPFRAPIYYISKVWYLSFHWKKIMCVPILDNISLFLLHGQWKMVIFFDRYGWKSDPKMEYRVIFCPFFGSALHTVISYSCQFLLFWPHFLFQWKLK